MLSIISQFKSEYQKAPKIEKSAITQRVLEAILQPRDGSARPRFLKKAGNRKRASGSGWLELCEKEVHKKIAHTLREQKTIKRLTTNEAKGSMEENSQEEILLAGEEEEEGDEATAFEESIIVVVEAAAAGVVE